MEQSEMRKILALVRDGLLDPEEAMLRIREAPYTDLGFARIDNHRQIRQGFAEVIYGAGKTKEQILSIASKMREGGVKTILITRLSPLCLGLRVILPYISDVLNKKVFKDLQILGSKAPSSRLTV